MFSLRVIPDHCRNGYSIQNIFKRLYFPAFNCLISASILLIFHISSIAQISVQFKQTGKKSSVESFVHDNHELISISSFAEALNYSCQWDRFSQRLTCRKNNDSISFVQDNTFIMRNGVTAKLSLAPLRFGSHFSYYNRFDRSFQTRRWRIAMECFIPPGSGGRIQVFHKVGIL